MRFKEDIDILTFLKRVKDCEDEVFFETDEGDRLNLKSVLSQYICAMIVNQKDVLQNCRITCSESDLERLQDYLVS